jgi:hypothetical protein
MEKIWNSSRGAFGTRMDWLFRQMENYSSQIIVMTTGEVAPCGELRIYFGRSIKVFGMAGLILTATDRFQTKISSRLTEKI